MTYDEGISLTSVDMNRIDGHRLVADRVRLDDRHVVLVDREDEVRVARERDKAETVTLALGDRNDSKLSVAVAACKAAQAVNQDRVWSKSGDNQY